SLPCPAEMAASIHINGTGSSVVDTIFVCRCLKDSGQQPQRVTPNSIALLVQEDIARLRAGNVEPTAGDVRCILFGHLVRGAIGGLRPTWTRQQPTEQRLTAIATWIERFGGLKSVDDILLDGALQPKRFRSRRNGHQKAHRGTLNAHLSF